jgi:hypothetical protein
MQCVASALAVLIASVLVTFTSPKSSLIFRIVRQAGWSALLLSAPFVATVNGLLGRWNVWDASARGAK